MRRVSLFTDVSVNPELKTGFGAYLIVQEIELAVISGEKIKNDIKLKKFESTSSTKLEIETLLWALEDVERNHLFSNLTIYTDSQCIVGLLGRREKLEHRNFKSIGKKKDLNNAFLYRRFYNFHDKLRFELIKLTGHSKSHNKDIYHKIFSYVDKESRMALRMHL